MHGWILTSGKYSISGKEFMDLHKSILIGLLSYHGRAKSLLVLWKSVVTLYSSFPGFYHYTVKFLLLMHFLLFRRCWQQQLFLIDDGFSFHETKKNLKTFQLQSLTISKGIQWAGTSCLTQSQFLQGIVQWIHYKFASKLKENRSL